MLVKRVAQVRHHRGAFLFEERRELHQGEVVVLQDEHELVAGRDAERPTQRVGDAVREQVVLDEREAPFALDVDDRLLVAMPLCQRDAASSRTVSALR